MRLTPEQAKELSNSEMWKAFCGELDNEIQALYQSISVCKPEQLQALQAKVQQLIAVKLIPQNVIDVQEA